MHITLGKTLGDAMKQQWLIVGAALALVACNSEKKELSSASAVPDTVMAAPIEGASNVDGKSVFDAKCAMCHSMQDPSPVGPSVAEIAQLPAYKGNAEAVVAWAKAPSATPKRAGKSAMPAQVGSDAELKAAAEYMLAQAK